MQKKNIFLHTPPGTRPFFSEESWLKDEIEKRLFDFYRSWNYFHFESPIIDYYDIYSTLMTENQKKSVIKFVNNDGDLILLRNDITLFSAKALISRSTRFEKTLKYFYSGQIIRSEIKNSPQEYYQIGCEIVSVNKKFEDLELLSILIESCNILEINSFQLNLFDINIYEKLLKGLDRDVKRKIISNIKIRNINEIKKIFENINVDLQKKEDLIKLAGFIGNYEDFKNVQLNNMEIKNELLNILDVINELGYIDKIVIDGSEVTDIDYYNGLYFNVYCKDIEMPIATGGQYDNLFNSFGVKRYAIGFSFWLYPLEKMLQNIYKNNQKVELISIENNFAKAFKNGLKEIKNNKIVKLNY